MPGTSLGRQDEWLWARAWPRSSGLVVPTASGPDKQGQSKVTCLYGCEVNSDLSLWDTSCVAGKSCVP